MPSAERSLAPRARVPLAPFTTLGVGGDARWFARATTIDEIAAAQRWCDEHGVMPFVLGGGSNVVIADEGFDGLVLHVDLRGVEYRSDGGDTLLRAGAGESWDDLVSSAVSRGLAGIECLSGIPGSAGGTPIQNVGAYGQEVANTIDTVVVFDWQTAQPRTLSAADCGFSYRTSRFKRSDAGRFIVCEVTFRLRPGPPTITYSDVVTYFERQSELPQDVAGVRQAVLAIRRGKGMVIDEGDPDTRSVGSFFMNPVVPADVHAAIAAEHREPVPGFAQRDGGVKIPAAWLIERSGLALGQRRGRAAISSKHPLALVNLGGATAREVIDLARDVKQRVADRFGIWLRPEPVFAGFEDDETVAYLLKG